MSRGSKIFYINTQPSGNITTNINAQIAPNVAQDGDVAVCIQTNAINNITTDYNTHLPADNVYQYDVDTWVILSNRETAFSDPNIIPNVTKIRRAHIEENRNFMHYVQRYYGRRYGDSWFNMHDMSQAVFAWYSENDYAKLYIANYGADNDWLTFEFGDNVTDKIRFVNRTPSSNVAVDNIFDIGGSEIRSYVQAYFNMNVYMLGNLEVDLDAWIKGNLSVDGTADILGATHLWNILIVDGITTHNEKVTLRSGTAYGIEFPGGTSKIVENGPSLETISTKNVVDVSTVLSSVVRVGGVEHQNWHAGNDGHTIDSTGPNADMIDGQHYSDILSRLTPVVNNTLYYDSGKDVDGAFVLEFKSADGGTTYYVPAAPNPAGTCHSNCHGNCHSNGRHCAKF